MRVETHFGYEVVFISDTDIPGGGTDLWASTGGAAACCKEATLTVGEGNLFELLGWTPAGDDYILVSQEAADALGAENLRYVLAHEAGHCHYGHLRGLTTDDCPGGVMHDEQKEIEADAFAASLVGAEALATALKASLRVYAQRFKPTSMGIVAALQSILDRGPQLEDRIKALLNVTEFTDFVATFETL